MPYRVIGIPGAVAAAVRTTRRSPFAGHPAHVEVATGHGPCRLCLRTFRIGLDRRILFTYDPFDGVEPFPLPGPVFIHDSPCEPYPADGGFPADLSSHRLTLNAYGAGRNLRAQVRADAGGAESAIEELLARPGVDYIHVRDTAAGCYDFRIERTAMPRPS